MDVIASEAKQSLVFHSGIATACKAGLAMTTPQIAGDGTVGSCLVTRDSGHERRKTAMLSTRTLVRYIPASGPTAQQGQPNQRGSPCSNQLPDMDGQHHHKSEH